jgi:ketosteroid isomerase-like protein
MSQQNVEWARKRYEALRLAVRAGDFDGFVRDYVHPDVEWVPLPGSPDSLAVQHGHAAMKARFAAMLEAIDEPQIEAQEFIDAGVQTVVAVRVSGRGKASGAEVDGRLFHVVTEDHDKLVRVEWYTSRAEALKAVGLEE